MQEIGYYSQANFNLEEINYNLKKQIIELQSGIPWWVYAGGGSAATIIIYLIYKVFVEKK